MCCAFDLKYTWTSTEMFFRVVKYICLYRRLATFLSTTNPFSLFWMTLQLCRNRQPCKVYNSKGSGGPRNIANSNMTWFLKLLDLYNSHPSSQKIGHSLIRSVYWTELEQRLFKPPLCLFCVFSEWWNLFKNVCRIFIVYVFSRVLRVVRICFWTQMPFGRNTLLHVHSNTDEHLLTPQCHHSLICGPHEQFEWTVSTQEA